MDVRSTRIRNLSLRGLQAYFGSAQHRRSIADRRQAIADATASAQLARRALIAAGLRCDVITGGGTGTFMFEAGGGVYTEIQPGSYALMDIDYAQERARAHVADVRTSH